MAKKAVEALRAKYVQMVSEALKAAGEEILVTGSNEVCIPVVDGDGDDQYVVFTVKVPTGDRDGTPYDGYAMAEEYKMKQAEKAAKAKEAAEKKAKKIEADRKAREAKAAAKAARNAGQS